MILFRLQVGKRNLDKVQDASSKQGLTVGLMLITSGFTLLGGREWGGGCDLPFVPTGGINQAALSLSPRASQAALGASPQACALFLSTAQALSFFSCLLKWPLYFHVC